MLTGLLLLGFLVLNKLPTGLSSSLLCGRIKEVELGSNSGAGAALALALIRPASASSRAPCQLRLTAPDAAAFTLRLIDVKESVPIRDWDRGYNYPQEGHHQNKKWSAKTAHAQDTADELPSPTVNNVTDACKLLIYIGEAKTPIWRLSLCGANAAAVAARAGSKLLPPKIRIVWSPPSSPYHHTDKLRLIVTAVNSGDVCNDDTQFACGDTGLCISSSLLCDGVRHCSGGEDEEPSMCSHRREPPFLEVLRRFAARNQEILGLDDSNGTEKPSVISDLKLSVKVAEGEQKNNAFMEFAAALKPYGPWSYLVVGMLLCAVVLMFCLAWECCCKRTKPSDSPVMPQSCIDLSPTVTVTSASQRLFTSSPLAAQPPEPPEYDPPPSYSSLFPRAFKSSPTPVPHCSHQQPD